MGKNLSKIVSFADGIVSKMGYPISVRGYFQTVEYFKTRIGKLAKEVKSKKDGIEKYDY